MLFLYVHVSNRCLQQQNKGSAAQGNRGPIIDMNADGERDSKVMMRVE